MRIGYLQNCLYLSHLRLILDFVPQLPNWEYPPDSPPARRPCRVHPHPVLPPHHPSSFSVLPTDHVPGDEITSGRFSGRESVSGEKGSRSRPVEVRRLSTYLVNCSVTPGHKSLSYRRIATHHLRPDLCSGPLYLRRDGRQPTHWTRSVKWRVLE